jgi:hypothetical protein
VSEYHGANGFQAQALLCNGMHRRQAVTSQSHFDTNSKNITPFQGTDHCTAKLTHLPVLGTASLVRVTIFHAPPHPQL